MSGTFNLHARFNPSPSSAGTSPRHTPGCGFPGRICLLRSSGIGVCAQDGRRKIYPHRKRVRSPGDRLLGTLREGPPGAGNRHVSGDPAGRKTFPRGGPPGGPRETRDHPQGRTHIRRDPRRPKPYGCHRGFERGLSRGAGTGQCDSLPLHGTSSAFGTRFHRASLHAGQARGHRDDGGVLGA